MPKRTSGLVFVWLCIIVVLIDQWVKYEVLQYLTPYEPYEITSFFSLMLAFNTGAAFSMLSSGTGWQLWLFSCVAVIICILLLRWLARLKRHQVWLCSAIALILGGAIGNLVDRLTLGYVVDYFLLHIHSYAWPTFNVADSAICIGAVMLVLDVFFQWRKKS